MLHNTLTKGRLGETIASEYLKSHGYTIVKRNYRIRFAEVDLIAIDNQTLVFVEVKTRLSYEYGRPEEAVTPHKLRSITKVALSFQSQHPELPQLMRIDVVSILLNPNRSVKHLEHLKNVTG
jgi:putative endonuclease